MNEETEKTTVDADELDDAADRRRYFRVEDEVLLDFRVVPPDGLEALREELAQPLPEPFALMTEFSQIRQTNTILRRSVEKESSATARYLTMLDRKLDRIAEVLMVQAMNATREMVHRVDLGAEGMAFTAQAVLPKGTIIDLTIALLSSSSGVRTVAKVLRCMPDPEGGFRIAVEFEHAGEATRELLVQHVLRRQAEQLRRSRLEQDD